MAVSRPVLIALIAALLALVGFYATSGARQSSDSTPVPATPKRSSTPAKDASSPGTKARTADNRRDSAKATRPSTPAPRSRQGKAIRAGMPAGLTRALAGKRTVVLFFFQRGSADDDATARAVASLRPSKRVQVFSAPISRLADYQTVVGGAGVSQAPTVVIFGRDRRARLVEGFVDPETLAQQVADAR